MQQHKSSYLEMLDTLAQRKQKAEDEQPKKPQPELEIYLKAPDVYLEDCLHDWGPLPPHTLAIGKVLKDGHPLLIDLNSAALGRVLHIMSDDWTRMEVFVKALVHGINVQCHPFDAAARVTYAMVNQFSPVDWEFEYRGRSAPMPMISAKTKNGAAIETFIQEQIAQWKSKHQTGFFFLPALDQLSKVAGGTSLLQYITSLISAPDRDVRFVLTTSFVTDYKPLPSVTQLVTIGNDYGSQFVMRDGRFLVKARDLWLEFDILQPKP
jgi:hypothetical protein